jgi:hypothetical protein
MAAQNSQDDPGKPCLELQDALSKQLPPEPAQWSCSRAASCGGPTTRCCPRAGPEDVEDDAHSRRKGRCGCAGPGLLEKLIGLNAWCKVTVLRLKSCGLGEGGGRSLLEALRVNTTVTSLNLGFNGLGEGRGRALAETLHLNIALTSLKLSVNGLGEDGGRALADALRLNITVKLLNLHANDLREEVRSALGEAWGDKGE